MSSGKRRETGSGKGVSEEDKLAKRRSRSDHAARLLELARDKLRKQGEDAPPNLVDLLPEAQRKVNDAKKYDTDHHVHIASSFVDTLMPDPFLTGIEVIAGRRKGARMMGRGDEKRQKKFADMREWLGSDKEREYGWRAKLNRAMAKKWGIKKTDAARKFIDRHINKLND
jgi:hypothetical protein